MATSIASNRSKQTVPKPQADFSFLETGRIFLRRPEFLSLKTLSDPQVYLLDQYIKHVLTGMKKAGFKLPLRLFFTVASVVCREVAGEKIRNDPALRICNLIVDRLCDDVLLARSLNAKTKTVRSRTAVKLKKRGLL